MMATFQKRLLFVLGLAVALAQQSAGHATRIICSPPTLKIVRMVRPQISPDAKNIFGKVIVQTEIDKTGKPSSVKILSGHPILAAAVLDAVRQWRWKLLQLNGLAVEAETTITVKFAPK
jgi:TonB family protein